MFRTVAWQSGWDETREAAEAFGAASQPVSVLIADGREVRRWHGPIGGEVVGLVQDLIRT